MLTDTDKLIVRLSSYVAALELRIRDLEQLLKQETERVEVLNGKIDSGTGS